MDCVSPMLSLAGNLWNCTAKHSSHILDLRENLECLREELQLLNRRNEDVKRRVEDAKRRQMTGTNLVEGWLHDAAYEKNEVAAVLQEGDGLLRRNCIGRCGNIRLSHHLGKRVNQKIIRVKYLISIGEFKDVAVRSPRSTVDELPVGRTVGLDSLYEKVGGCLADDTVGVVGLYGKPGVGKTTLMKKINNGLLETCHDFDTVIWVSLPNQATAGAVQKVIGNKLQIIDSDWQNRSQDENATEIYSVMKAKRFLLLLDNLQKRLDLSEIGVPIPNSRNRSKVIIATRSERTCCEMRVHRLFKVRPLEWEEAWTLFRELIGGEDTLNSTSDGIARSILTRCQGLPSAITMAGRAFAACDVGESQQFRLELEDLIEKEISGEDRLPQAFGDGMPIGNTVGLDSLYVRVCNCLSYEHEVRIIGLYGKVGVGKTALMRKIYHEFLKTSYQFDTVIWVSVSKQASVGAAQEEIRNKLQIPDSMWQNRREDERAREIFNIMKTKRFVLLLDDVWQRFDLSEIGVPPIPEIRNGSKVMIATQFLNICNEMEVQRKFMVDCSAPEEALNLFPEKVGENTLNSRPDIPQLSKKMAMRCKGLLLQIIFYCMLFVYFLLTPIFLFFLGIFSVFWL